MAKAQGGADELKEMNGLLNKLTVKNFEKISAQMAEILTARKKDPSAAAKLVTDLMSAVFDKAVADQFYIDLYIRLTLFLNDHIKSTFEGTDMNFRGILIGHCQ